MDIVDSPRKPSTSRGRRTLRFPPAAPQPSQAEKKVRGDDGIQHAVTPNKMCAGGEADNNEMMITPEKKTRKHGMFLSAEMSRSRRLNAARSVKKSAVRDNKAVIKEDAKMVTPDKNDEVSLVRQFKINTRQYAEECQAAGLVTGSKDNPFDMKQFKNKQWCLDDFDVGYLVGRGKFGKVLMVKVKETGYVMALKRMSKKFIEKNNMTLQIQREIEIHSHLVHPNILRLFGYFVDKKYIYIMLEYAPGGELTPFIREQGHFPEPDAATIISELASALWYCHNAGIIHRDVKPENLLIGWNGELKLADFGWAAQTNTRRKTFCGTLEYLSPELVNKALYSYEVDSWCVGVLTYELLVGTTPFLGESDDETYDNIVNVRYTMPKHLSESGRDFLRTLLVKNADERLKIAQIPVHPWCQQNIINRTCNRNKFRFKLPENTFHNSDQKKISGLDFEDA